ncbi:succinate--CoA ligase subunit beta [Bisgaardia hudsonensis]|nr:ADP-forming succinate--CoA ligase subunit beta [Bisgaardia hudsonensis]QLB12898.1 succinate--CoA ligase subunit beta [Bisgaardia hudsonensis]
MNLHEYQSKAIFSEYGVPVSSGILCHHIDEGLAAISKLGGQKWVAKCQVHAGGRGKAGGVKVCKSAQEVRSFFDTFLGKPLVTAQTNHLGNPVHSIYIEPYIAIKKELYLSLIVDRSLQRVVVIASAEGGVDIETVAQKTPHLLHKVVLDPLVGAMPYQGRALAFKLGLQGAQVSEFSELFCKLGKLFKEKDLALVEINPLIIQEDNHLHCLDAKIVVDNNALFRHSDLLAMRDSSQEDPREAEAEKYNLSYVALEGNIGCVVNGAGLAMGTMDTINFYGGKPANFLDIGGGATKERMIKAFNIIFTDHSVKAVIVNIFGGIVRCDLIAEAIISAVNEIGVKVPVVVRLEGTNAEQGHQILSQSNINIIAVNSLAEAAKKVVQLAEGK